MQPGSDPVPGMNEGQAPIEAERKPRYRLMVTRHSERLPSGELSPEGIAHAAAKGESLKGLEVLKGYASDHSSGRAFDTAQLLTEGSEVRSKTTDEQYTTRLVPDIQYDILKPDLYDETIKNAKLIIETATLNEVTSAHPDVQARINQAVAANYAAIVTKQDAHGQPMVDIEKLPKDIKIDIAKIRQKYQPLGFEYVFGLPKAIHRMAIGLSHQLVEKERLIARYDRGRTSAKQPLSADAVVNLATHGMFVESLLIEAGILVQENGEEIHGIRDFQSSEFGGYIMPAESIYLEIDDPQQLPARIPVTFEGAHRPNGRVFIDREKLTSLNADYLAFRQEHPQSATS